MHENCTQKHARQTSCSFFVCKSWMLKYSLVFFSLFVRFLCFWIQRLSVITNWWLSNENKRMLYPNVPKHPNQSFIDIFLVLAWKKLSTTFFDFNLWKDEYDIYLPKNCVENFFLKKVHIATNKWSWKYFSNSSPDVCKKRTLKSDFNGVKKRHNDYICLACSQIWTTKNKQNCAIKTRAYIARVLWLSFFTLLCRSGVSMKFNLHNMRLSVFSLLFSDIIILCLVPLISQTRRTVQGLFGLYSACLCSHVHSSDDSTQLTYHLFSEIFFLSFFFIAFALFLFR